MKNAPHSLAAVRGINIIIHSLKRNRIQKTKNRPQRCDLS